MKISGPDEPTRIAVKFWLDCLQALTVVAGIIVATSTVLYHHRQQAQYLAATTRELQQPYEEKKLALYLDASRVAAHLAATPDLDREKNEARFWELYWGELAFVESRKTDEANGGPTPSVETLMIDFCHTYFSPSSRCHTKTAVDEHPVEKDSTNTREKAAIDLAHQASKEIRMRWEELGK